MTLGLSDGKQIYAVRYASDGHAPTLYHSRDAEGFYRDHPEVEGTLGPSTRFVVSEPGGKYQDLWIEVPQSSCLRICAGSLRSCRSSRSRPAIRSVSHCRVSR